MMNVEDKANNQIIEETKEDDIIIETKSEIVSNPVETIENELISYKLDEINQTLINVEKTIKSEIKTQQISQKIIDTLHFELQQYKNDLVFTITKPIIFDYIEILESIIKTKMQFQSDNSNAIILALDLLIEECVYTLEKNDVQIVDILPGLKFESLKQKIIKVVLTDNSELDKCVESIHSNGYQYKNTVLIPQKVSVYKFEKPIN